VNLTVRIWRQAGPDAGGQLVDYQVDHVSPDMSFLETLDILNEGLILRGEEPIALDHDCREGICGSCGVGINGRAHGPEQTTSCQLHMRSFSDGDVIDVEPWRSRAFPVIKDLVVDRSAFDRIIQSGGYITAPPGPHRTRTRPRCRNRPRQSLGERQLHRLWRLRRGLPERIGRAIHQRQNG
jgi:succinate dehydrogenase / fumarate reductase, iron-sulfur subunit